MHDRCITDILGLRIIKESRIVLHKKMKNMCKSTKSISQLIKHNINIKTR
jgi:hypothetical protein